MAQFNFANPWWLIGTVIAPIIWLIYNKFYHGSSHFKNLEKFADRHLLPHLLKSRNIAETSTKMPLIIWSIIWLCGVIALAGPRWNFTEIETFGSNKSMVILLDLSQSMDSADVKPSRIARARQEIEDLINLNKNNKIGIVAFAAEPHLISPITEDMETIKNLLPSLDTSLVYIQGSRLTPALEMAENLLKSEPGGSKAILLISDGGYEDNSAIDIANKIGKSGIIINTMGIGTQSGAPVPDKNGNIIKKDGAAVLSHLEGQKLQEIGKNGNGIYVEANYLDSDTKAILATMDNASAAAEANHKTRYWDEKFYLLVFTMMLLVLPMFRRGAVVVIFVILLFPQQNAEASTLSDWFSNPEMQGKSAFDKGDYAGATQKFNDPYRRGVAEYKAGNFAEAEKSFAAAKRPEIAANAEYNLGNAQIQQKKYKEAIATYEDVLKKNPDHKNAQNNLAIAKKLLEQDPPQQDKNQQDNKDNKDQNKDDKQNQDQKQPEGDKSKDDSKDSKSDNKNDTSPQQNADNKDDKNKKPDDAKNDPNKDQQQNVDDKPGKKDAKSSDDKEQKPGEKQQEAANQNNDDKQKPQNTKRTQVDVDADQWLSRIQNNPKQFLKNQFYIESKRNGTKETSEPW
jgi:Ca-activated chloride channel family protein